MNKNNKVGNHKRKEERKEIFIKIAFYQLILYLVSYRLAPLQVSITNWLIFLELTGKTVLWRNQLQKQLQFEKTAGHSVQTTKTLLATTKNSYFLHQVLEEAKLSAPLI